MAQPFSARLRYFSIFIPFRLYLLLFAAGIFVAWAWLQMHQHGVANSFTAILALLTKALLLFGAAVLILSFLSVLIPFILFLIHKKSGRLSVKIETAEKDMEGTVKQPVKMVIHPLVAPLFGFLRYRLVYDGQKLSPKFSAIDTGNKLQLFSATQQGLYHWPLPEIKEYNLEKLVIYFEDLFQFFSFSKGVPVTDTFFTRPAKKEVAELNLAPKKTEEQATRIEELRKVEGEYLNYKNFENNDDVRRIVWKIYAKNKELVVRTPEVLDPFASHIYLYATYADGIDAADNTIIAQQGLNYFKTATWSVYNRLKQQGFEIRYIPDQELKPGNVMGQDNQTQYNISLSQWHKGGDLKNYVNTKIASVVCISSLTPAAEVQALSDVLPKDASVIFIKLSNSFKKQGIVKWVRWLFLEEEKEAGNRHLMQWNLSNDRRKMMKNEKAIAEILSRAEAKTVVI